ncbi:MAG: hypothetical protein AB7F74_06070 [Parvibaculaceae bacterium]
MSTNQRLIQSTITEWVETLGGLIKDLLNPSSGIRVQLTKMVEAVTCLFNAMSVKGQKLDAVNLIEKDVGAPLP